MVEPDIKREPAIVVLARRELRVPRYRPVIRALRSTFPAVMASRGNTRVAIFLKRHEHVWASAYRLLGWEELGRYEVSLGELAEVCEESERALEPLRSSPRIPGWLAPYLGVTASLGVLPCYEVASFLELVKRRFSEYMEVPKAMRGPRKREPRLHKLLRTSRLAVLIVSGTSREEQLRRVSEYLHELLMKGVVPVDYSHNTIIVAAKVYKRRGVERVWRSPLGLNPVEVIKGFESRYVPVVTDVRDLEFERRDVGWGLKVV